MAGSGLDALRCRCGHSAGGHGRAGCALCATCPGFAPRLGERLREALRRGYAGRGRRAR